MCQLIPYNNGKIKIKEYWKKEAEEQLAIYCAPWNGLGEAKNTGWKASNPCIKRNLQYFPAKHYNYRKIKRKRN